MILGAPGSHELNILKSEACQKYGVEIGRAVSIFPKMLYQDIGSLNFTVTSDTSFLKHLIEDFQPILSGYQILNESIAKGLQIFGINVNADPYGVYIHNLGISEALPNWFYDFLLFQGTLHINTNLNVCNEVIKAEGHHEKNCMLTSLSRELGKRIKTEEVKKALVHGFEERLDVRFEKQGLTEDEQKLSEKLYRVKYSLRRWNVDGTEPFLVGMGKTTVEVFVAYPPTSRCRELIHLVNDVASNWKDEVKVMIWMRGKSTFQNGPYPEFSSILPFVEKQNIIPAIIINGELKFHGSAPPKEDLRKTILNAL
jgi:hypothetical protein